MIPTADQCFELMEKYHMLANIRAHSIMVERVATLIAGEIRQTGTDISMSMVTAGALMHDIAKTQCLNTHSDHAAMGCEICMENRLDEIADIVREHVIIECFDPCGEVNEKEIIYYADKRINHDRLVSLDDRLKDLLIRYAKGDKRLEGLIEDNFRQCRSVEKKIFDLLSFSPEDIVGMI